MADQLEFRLLGPVEAWQAEHRVPLGPAEAAKTRCMLAALLCTPGVPVATETLVEQVWGSRPPGSAVRYKYISWLRSALAPHGVVLKREGAGYVVDADPEQVDLHRFRRLVAAARRTAGEESDRLLDQALALWRGPALAGLSGVWAELLRDQLERERRGTRVLVARRALASGRHADAALWLAAWESAYPVDEEVIGLHMLALHHCGQQAEALACYDRAQRRLTTSLGIRPGTWLESLHRDLQAGTTPPMRSPADDKRVVTTTTDRRIASRNAAPDAPVKTVPRQLPAISRHFSGRARELAQLDSLLDEDEHGPGPTAVIAAIGGGAGIGKTTLAVHWAHRVADRFPDGQLFVNLRGFAPDTAPMAAEEALYSFLVALGVEPGRVPAGSDARAALYRSMLVGRRVLAVLDNARDAEHVRPLLPAAATCMAVVTSRNRLAGLVAVEGAHPITLGLLTPAEAGELLADRIGSSRLAAEPEAASQIAARGCRLPLALAVIATRAALHPDFGLTALAGELRTADGLDALAADEPPGGVRAAFSWSYRALAPDAARLFRLSGLHQGPELTVPAAASLAAVPSQQARTLLAELAGAHLMTEQSPGRYATHDLLHAYAAEQSAALDADDERHAAVHRMLDYYLHTAHAAVGQLHLCRNPVTLAPPREGVAITPLADPEAALAWLTAERAVLVAVTEHAAHNGFGTHSWQLAWTLTTYLDRYGHWRTRHAVHTAALAGAVAADDRQGQALMHLGLANADARLGHLDEAHRHLKQSIALFEELDDDAGQAQAHLTLVFVLEREKQLDEVLVHAHRAFELYQRTDDAAGQARALHEIGWQHALRGDNAIALDHCLRSLRLLEDLRDRYGQAGAWDSLGYIHHQNGDFTRAVSCYNHSLQLLRDIGDHPHQGEVLIRLGETHRAAGDPLAARDAWQRALTALEELGHPDTDEIKAKISAISAQ